MQPVEQLRVSENFASFNDGQFVYFLDQFVMLCLTEAPNREHIENNRLSIVLHFPNLFFSLRRLFFFYLQVSNFVPDIGVYHGHYCRDCYVEKKNIENGTPISYVGYPLKGVHCCSTINF